MRIVTLMGGLITLSVLPVGGVMDAHHKDKKYETLKHFGCTFERVICFKSHTFLEF